MLTITQFDALYLRAVAELSNTSVLLTGLRLGPPPSGGGGGPIINEGPGVPARSHADGNGSGLDILRLSGVDLLVGFTLKGTVKLVFAGANPAPTGDQLSFQVIAGDAPEVPDFPDADGDGVEDSVDNCPNDFNPGQEDGDGDGDVGDGVGDVCDNCPDDLNPGQEDEDVGGGDGTGDVCDNCAPGVCNPDVRAPLNSCSNADQSDEDNDGVGFKCDNCPDTPNGPDLGTCLTGDTLLVGTDCTEDAACGTDGFCSKNQENENTPGSVEGDACEPSELSLTFGAPAAPAGASVGVIGDGGASASAASTSFDLYLSCGPRNISEANVGILLPVPTDPDTPSDLFDNFALCLDPPEGSGDHKERNCPDVGSDLGPTIDPTTSSTLGPEIFIDQPPFGTSISNRFVVLKLKGGLPGGLLCEAFDRDAAPGGNENNLVYLGPLNLSNLPDDSSPALSENGLAAFTPPLKLLVGASGTAVDPEKIETSVDLSGDADIVALLSVFPTHDDNDEGRRFAVIMAAPTEQITAIAFGLRGPAGIQPDQMVFGGCITPAEEGGIAVNSCGDENGPTDEFDLGSEEYVYPGILSDEGGTYTVPPNSGADLAIPDDTLMVALAGNYGLQFTLNVPPGAVLLGVVQYTNIEGYPPLSAPSVDFQGATALPGVTAAVRTIGGGTIDTNQVGRVISGNADLDRDEDNRGDNADNCPNFPNPLQLNGGGLLFVGPGDFIGDLCTCGDSSGDGVIDDRTVTGVDESDVEDCQKFLAMPTTEAAEIGAAQRCSVQTGEEVPTILDLIVMELELNAPDSSGASIEQVCAPAN
jgi:hypothetical protein